MTHLYLDAYESTSKELNSMEYIYKILEEIPKENMIPIVSTPVVIPFHDDLKIQNEGVSGFIFLDIGHFTIHTFANRNLYFIDFVSDSNYDEEKLKSTINKYLPSNTMNYSSIDREAINDENTYKETTDFGFGPHVFLNGVSDGIDLRRTYYTFMELPENLDMDPISIPIWTENEKQISFIIVISESHISFHYSKVTNKVYFDLFTCKSFDYNKVISELEKVFGHFQNKRVILRGDMFKK